MLWVSIWHNNLQIAFPSLTFGKRKLCEISLNTISLFHLSRCLPQNTELLLWQSDIELVREYFASGFGHSLQAWGG